MDLGFVGVLRDASNKFYVDVQSHPGVWTEFYTELGEDIVRATFVALAPFETLPEAQAFADKLREMDYIDEWVAQSNPNFDDISHRWFVDLESSSLPYLHARIRHLEKLASDLEEAKDALLLKLYYIQRGREPGDDYDPGDGGVPCPLVPKPPRLSPGYRREPPAPEPE